MENQYKYLEPAIAMITYLQGKDIDPILYGSLGASLYLGKFKVFSDIDLLVPSVWVHEKWGSLCAIMEQFGFAMVDEHEHEFKNAQNLIVAFADDYVLIRDGVLTSLSQVVTRQIENSTIRTLSPEGFIQAYTFSEKDGYRKDTRGKKDRDIITLLRRYVTTV